MEGLYTRCAGLDGHKKTAIACVHEPLPDAPVQRFVRTFSAITAELRVLDDWLRERDVEPSPVVIKDRLADVPSPPYPMVAARIFHSSSGRIIYQDQISPGPAPVRTDLPALER